MFCALWPSKKSKRHRLPPVRSVYRSVPRVWFVPKSVAVWTVLQCFFAVCCNCCKQPREEEVAEEHTVHNPPDPKRTHVQLCADCPSGRVFSQQRKRTSRPPRQREGGKGPYGRIGAARKAVVPLECIPYSSVVCVCDSQE